MKKCSYKKLALKNEVNKIFNITQAYKSKEKFLAANGVSKCSQNDRQVIRGNQSIVI